jgi:tetratricopeptide (TPR) repeat protein
MRTRSGFASLATVLALALPAGSFAVGLPVVAIAGDARPAPSRAELGDAGDARNDPSNITAISRWMELCIEGNAKYAARDFSAAIASYTSATRLAPKNPFPQYLLGEAHLANGNLAEAEASLKQAELASDKRNALLRAKILFVLADVKERQKKWDEAKAAWQLYSEWVFAQSNGGTFPLSAAARIRAIDEVLKLDGTMQIVRERIAATSDGGVLGSASTAVDRGVKSAPSKK